MNEQNQRLPKYTLIKDTIRKEIDEGILSQNEKLPPETVLIERFQASKMTVVRALQELVQEGYLTRTQGRGTYVTSPQKHLPLIGVLIPGFSHGIYSILLRSIEKHAHEMGYSIMLCCTDTDTDKVESFAEELIKRKATGIIAAPLERVTGDEANVRWYAMFQSANIPVVLVDRGIPSLEHSVLVDTDNEESMTKLTRLVKQKGHKRLLYIMYDGVKSTTSESRIQGFLQAAKEHPSTELAEIYRMDTSLPMQETLERFEQILVEHDPTVLLVSNDLLALELFGLLKKVQTGVGMDVSLTGFDDLPFAEAIGLTTIKQPLEQVGTKAVDLLHQMVLGNPVQSVRLECELIDRKSLADYSSI